MTLNYPRTYIFAIGLLFAQQAIATPVRLVNAAPELIAIIHEHPVMLRVWVPAIYRSVEVRCLATH